MPKTNSTNKISLPEKMYTLLPTNCQDRKSYLRALLYSSFSIKSVRSKIKKKSKKQLRSIISPTNKELAVLLDCHENHVPRLLKQLEQEDGCELFRDSSGGVRRIIRISNSKPLESSKGKQSVRIVYSELDSFRQLGYNLKDYGIYKYLENKLYYYKTNLKINSFNISYPYVAKLFNVSVKRLKEILNKMRNILQRSIGTVCHNAYSTCDKDKYFKYKNKIDDSSFAFNIYSPENLYAYSSRKVRKQ